MNIKDSLFFLIILSFCGLLLPACSFITPKVEGTEVKNISCARNPNDLGQSIELPSRVTMGQGGATIWLNFTLDKTSDANGLWLLMRNHQSVGELTINGIPMETYGQFPPQLFIPVGKYLVFHIPKITIDPQRGVPIKLRLYSDSTEMKLSRIYVVDQETAHFYENFVNLLNNDIYRYFAFLCFFIFVYFLVQFFQRRKDLPSLYFAIFNLFIGAYFYGIGLSWVGLPFLPFLAIFKGSLFIGISALLVFCISFSNKKYVVPKVIAAGIGIFLFCYVTFASTDTLNANIRFRHALWVGILMMLIAVFLVTYHFIKGQKELKPLVIGGCIAAMTGLIDAWSMLSGVETLFWLQGFGIFIFLLSVFMSLAGRTTRMHEELEGYARGIEAEVSRRTSQLNDSNIALSRASNAKSEFLAHMSHEIRTPLNSIIGFSQILEQRNSSEIDRYYSGLILRESEHLMQLISQVLDMSRIEQGKLILESNQFNLREAFASIIEGLTQSATAKGLSLTFSVKGVLPEYVSGDQLRFQQILINLLGNSIKFTEHGTIKVEAQILSTNESGGILLEVTVNDTGIGIAQEKLEVIFNRFEQADASITRKYGGTGLGITIARDLVRLMGGEIHIASTVGLGTRVTYSIHLSVVESKESAQPAVLDMPEQESWQFPKDFCVLVVDDYQANLEVVRVFLNKANILMIEAPSGHEAIEKFREYQNEIDLILMDIHMPDMDGFEATRQIRLLEDGPQRPIIALTADAFDETSAKCRQAGIEGVLIKPLRYDLLMATLYHFSAPRRQKIKNTLVNFKDVHQTDPELPIIDQDFLSETYYGDPEVVNQLLVLFSESGAKLIEELRVAIRDQSWEQMHLKAHTIKGGALNIGARNLSASSSHLEQLAKRQEMQPVVDVFQTIEQDWKDFLIEFQRLSQVRKI